MALPKKKSRSITLESIKYTWLVSPNDGYNVFVAQQADCQGSKIEVYFETDVNAYWVAFPQVSQLNLQLIKPREAALIILQAQQLGWEPEKGGKPLSYDWAGERLTPRKTIS
ncbi:hypothetical protein [Hymenobacter crusticola]|uniref:Uncharacterized protein n=1 Tax=Hymenobacter crusticola TaxID=1770526 RepID=A0A243W576_9BACT|nr:hypothetical protein [Hymenobacter crusticola]OUJ67374.1 hypothetical protein BXP70_28885 [Hymenobacter crusticola]